MRISNLVTDHAQLVGVTANQHHNQSHWSTHLNAGADKGVGTHIILRKTADETVNNSATLQDDNQLQFAIVTGERWHLNFLLILSSFFPTSDFKVGFRTDGSVGIWGSEKIYVNGALTAHNFRNNDLSGLSLIASVGLNAIVELEYDINVITGGTLFLQWAQNVAQVENTTVQENSDLEATRIA